MNISIQIHYYFSILWTFGCRTPRMHIETRQLRFSLAQASSHATGSRLNVLLIIAIW